MEHIVCTETNQIYVVKRIYSAFVTVMLDVLHCSCGGIVYCLIFSLAT